MPAHITFFDRLRGLKYSAQANATAGKGELRWWLAKRMGKRDQVQFSRTEQQAMHHVQTQGAYKPSDFTHAMKQQAAARREFVVRSYATYRARLDTYSPDAPAAAAAGPRPGGHRGQARLHPVAAADWRTCLAPDTLFDQRIKDIFAAYPRAEIVFVGRNSDPADLKRIEIDLEGDGALFTAWSRAG